MCATIDFVFCIIFAGFRANAVGNIRKNQTGGLVCQNAASSDKKQIYKVGCPWLI